MKVGLVVSSAPWSTSTTARTKAVFPAPSGPERATTSPGTKRRAKSAAKARSSASFLKVRRAGAAKASGMSADFGAEMEAALKGHIDAIRAAAEAAKERVDEGIAGVPAEPDPIFEAPYEQETSAPYHAPAVDFDLDEAPLEFDGPLDDDGVLELE